MAKNDATEGFDPLRLTEMRAKVGEDNEALRTLLNDAARRISDLDLVKGAYNKTSEPIVKTMRALEQEKLHDAALQTLLGDVRAAHEKQRNELQLSERRTASLENVNEKLREDLELAQQQTRSTEAARLDCSTELKAQQRPCPQPRERETALTRAEENIQSLTGRIAKLEADIQVSQAAHDKSIEELSAALHRERMERSAVEGALESARRDLCACRAKAVAKRPAWRSPRHQCKGTPAMIEGDKVAAISSVQP